MSSSRLDLVRISVRIGGRDILSGLNLSFKGRKTAIIGPNGSGKTTLLNVISGLVKRSSGRLLLDGKNISGLPAYKRARLGISRSYQSPRILNWTSVLENVAIAANPMDWGATAIFDRPAALAAANDLAQCALKAVNLDHFAQRRASSLSYGERKLVEIARILTVRPRVVLLDEPIAGLHPSSISIVTKCLENIARHEATIVFVEHNLDFVAANADHVIALFEGSIIADGPPAKVLENRAVLDAFWGQGSVKD